MHGFMLVPVPCFGCFIISKDSFRSFPFVQSMTVSFTPCICEKLKLQLILQQPHPKGRRKKIASMLYPCFWRSFTARRESSPPENSTRAFINLGGGFGLNCFTMEQSQSYWKKSLVLLWLVFPLVHTQFIDFDKISVMTEVIVEKIKKAL